MSRDLLYLTHILQCIEKIERFISYRKKRSIDQELIEDGIIRNLQIMAESTQKLSKSLKLNATDIPWHSLSGFRNILVHEYLGVDMTTIYKTIKNDLPKLKKRVMKMIVFCEKKEENL
jgi:uncharacterized protein with HEPN domain